MKVIELFVDQIVVVEGRNPRISLNGIEELAESIAENGIITPIKVESAPASNGAVIYRLVDGHRRVAACRFLADNADLNVTIPAVLVECRNESEVLIQMMVSNDSEPFNPFEEATLYVRLRDEFNLTVALIAKYVGKSASHVSDKIALLRADDSVKKAVEDKQITPSDANTIVRKSKGDKEVQKQTVDRVLEEGREAVIDRDLKKGRMSKAEWTVAGTTYDQVFQSGLEVGGLPNVKATLAAEDPIEAIKSIDIWTEDKAIVDFAFYMGKLAAFKELSNLSMEELWLKLEERLNI